MKLLLAVLLFSAQAQAGEIDKKTQDDLIQIARLCRILLQTSLQAERPYEMTQTKSALEFVSKTLESVERQKEAE